MYIPNIYIYLKKIYKIQKFKKIKLQSFFSIIYFFLNGVFRLYEKNILKYNDLRRSVFDQSSPHGFKCSWLWHATSPLAPDAKRL